MTEEETYKNEENLFMYIYVSELYVGRQKQKRHAKPHLPLKKNLGKNIANSVIPRERESCKNHRCNKSIETVIQARRRVIRFPRAAKYILRGLKNNLRSKPLYTAITDNIDQNSSSSSSLYIWPNIGGSET